MSAAGSRSSGKASRAASSARDLDIQVASYGLLGMLNWLYKWYDPQGRLGVQQVAEQFTSLALAGLAAAPAPPARRRTKPPR